MAVASALRRPFVRSALRRVAARAYWTSRHFPARFTGQVLILTYHRVIPPSEVASSFVQPGMYVTPETFERQIRFLSAEFELLSVRELVAMWHAGLLHPWRRYCAVTFDDGWVDNYRHAFPILRSAGVPATIFLATDLIGTREQLWSDRLGYLLEHHRGRRADVADQIVASVLRRCAVRSSASVPTGRDGIDEVIEHTKVLPDQERDELLNRLTTSCDAPMSSSGRQFLDWDEVREMSGQGITFGSHTRTHAALARMNREQLRGELQHSLAVLSRERVNLAAVLSYPYGSYSADVLSEVRAAGYTAAVTTDPGLESCRPSDLFRLKRIGVHEDVSRSLPLFAFHIARHAGRRARAM